VEELTEVRSLIPKVERLWGDLEELSRIGADPKGGLRRLAWTEEEFAAKAWVAGKLRELGLDPQPDAAANLWAELPGGEGPALVVGSHLDTVPQGGAFDGALGVLAAVEVARVLLESGRPLRRRVRLVAFTDEEGARFGTGLFGSSVVAGLLPVEEVLERTDAQGVTLAQAMRQRGYRPSALSQAQERLEGVACYLELHIEQGPRLWRRGEPAAVVPVITGIRQRRYVFVGEANHAGTTALEDRRDALLPASRLVQAVREAAAQERGGAVATVGMVDVEPGAANVVPGRVTMSVEVRSPDPQVMERVFARVDTAAQEAAAQARVELGVDEVHHVAPATMDGRLRELLHAMARDMGRDVPDLVSWAGHDAGALATRVPAAMVFVPSQDGVSHAPGEYTPPEYIGYGLTMLTRAVGAWALEGWSPG
jgi:hydantoinase/carbamoylase family amidase